MGLRWGLELVKVAVPELDVPEGIYLVESLEEDGFSVPSQLL